jgi:hypothetical protein
MAKDTKNDKPLIKAQEETTRVLGEAIAKLERTVALSGNQADHGVNELQQVIANTAHLMATEPPEEVKREEKQLGFLERIKTSMQNMSLASVKTGMQNARTDAKEAFQKRKDAILETRSGKLLKGIFDGIKGMAKSGKNMAKGGLKAFFTATGLLLLYNFLGSESWKTMVKKIKEFDFKTILRQLDEIVDGFKNSIGGIYTYFFGSEREGGGPGGGQNDGKGLFARLNKIKNDFNEEGWIAGFKSIWDNIGLWEATITGGIGLYLMKKTGILFLLTKIFGPKKGLIAKLFTKLGAVATFLGLKAAVPAVTAPAAAAAAKVAAKPVAKGAAKLGGSIVAKSGKILTEKTASGKVNPKYLMAKNLGKEIAPKSKAFGRLSAALAKRSAAKNILKKIPGFSLLVGGGLAINSLLDGDAVGAALHASSGVAGSLGPIGTAAGVGIDVGILMREIEKSKEMLPQLQGQQAALQKKMANRAQIAEMFGLKKGEGLQGKTSEQLKGLVANFKERFGTTELSDEQKKVLMDSGFFKKTVGSRLFGGNESMEFAGGDFNVSNLRRLQQLANVMKSDNSQMKEAEKGLTEFIESIKDYNNEVAKLKREQNDSGKVGNTNVDARVTDQSRTQVESAPVKYMGPPNTFSYPGIF